MQSSIRHWEWQRSASPVSLVFLVYLFPGSGIYIIFWFCPFPAALSLQEASQWSMFASSPCCHNKLEPLLAPSFISLSVSSNTDVHTVASLLKLYLRELPEPVVPFQKYDDFLASGKLLGKDDEMVRKKKFMSYLYRPRNSLLHTLFHHVEVRLLYRLTSALSPIVKKKLALIFQSPGLRL